MKTKLSSILATGKGYMQSLQNEQGRRVVSVLVVLLALSIFVVGRISPPTPVLMQQAMYEKNLEYRPSVIALAEPVCPSGSKVKGIKEYG